MVILSGGVNAPADTGKSTLAAEKDQPGGIQVIARAASILRALERRPAGMSLGELAAAVSLPRSTVQRIVDALAAEGLVLAASSARGVRLGPSLTALANAARFEIAEAARETLAALSRESGETVDLSIVDGDKIVFVDQVAGTHRLAAISGLGVAFPLHSSANGKAALAAMSDASLAKLRKKIRLTPLTANTITSWEALERELADIGKTGIAYDREENSDGISAIAMSVKSPSGELAAISIPVPTQRFAGSEKALAALLRKHVELLQRKLGGQIR